VEPFEPVDCSGLGFMEFTVQEGFVGVVESRLRRNAATPTKEHRR
jgi:hypothetical protein